MLTNKIRTQMLVIYTVSIAEIDALYIGRIERYFLKHFY
jgi:hypothetical protein